MNCRFCGAATGDPVLRLGAQPPANSFLTAEQVRAVEAGRLEETRVPLDLHLCSTCGLVQIAESLPPETLFSEYIYVSGTSDLIHRHAERVADLAEAAAGSLRGHLVVEIASNDGTVLRRFRDRGARVLGVEPAANVARVATEAGIPTRVEFFGEASARTIREEHGRARLVLARHVLAHVPDPHGFVEGVAQMLAPDGLFLIEAPYLEPFLTRTEFDTIYHEHLAYLAARPLQSLLDAHGLTLVDAHPFEIHGGSMLYTVAPAGATPKPSIAALLRRERELGLAERATWEQFAARTGQVRARLGELLESLGSDGSRLAGYGAPAKGNTLLCSLDRGVSALEFLVDRNPWKQGKYTPGTHLPVRPPEALIEKQPKYTLLLAWNFEEEILRQQDEYRRRGGRFIRPLPWPEVIP